MRRLLRVSSGTTIVAGVLLATSAWADDGVVLVGCDLFSRDGPRVAFVQIAGVSKSSSTKSRLVIGNPNVRGAGTSGTTVPDVEGRPCAEILSGLIDDDFKFKSMQVFGEDGDIALWFFQEN